MIRVTPLTAALCAAFLLPLPLQAQRNTNKAVSSQIASGISNTITQGANYSFIGSGWRNLIRTNGAGPNGMSFIGSGQSNTVGASWSVINGGFLNRISPSSTNGQMSFIGNGGENLIWAKYAVIAGGYNNLVSSNAAGGAIGGGYYNEVAAVRGTVPGGSYNEAGGSNSFAAGSYAVASNAGTFVWGDMSSTNDFVSTGLNQFLIRAKGGVGIGTNNPGTNALLVNGGVKITGDLSVATINGQTSSITGPQGPAGTNGSDGLAATIAVGTVTNGAPGTTALVTNIGTSNAAVFNFTIPSGANGAAGAEGPAGPAGATGPAGADGPAGPAGADGATGATGPAGSNGLNGTNGSDGAPGAAAVISGVTASNGPAGSLPSVTNIGSSTNASFAFTFPLVLPSGGAGVGTNNTAPGLNAVVAGGNSNNASGDWATIAGGTGNSASTNSATVGGGRNNTARGLQATVGGGTENTASGDYATIPGGQLNVATNNAFAAGTLAKATNNGAFVWADSKEEDFGSTDSNQFLIRAQNGVGINTNNPGPNALSVNGPVQIGTIQVLTGPGVPEIAAPNGSIYLRTDGIESETLYIRSQDLWLPVFVSAPSGPT